MIGLRDEMRESKTMPMNRATPKDHNKMQHNKQADRQTWAQLQQISVGNRRCRSHVDLIIMIMKFIDYLSCFARTDLNIPDDFLLANCLHILSDFINFPLLSRGRLHHRMLNWKLQKLYCKFTVAGKRCCLMCKTVLKLVLCENKNCKKIILKVEDS